MLLIYFLATLLMSFLNEAVHFVRCNLTQSFSSSVAFGENFSLGVFRRLLQSVQRSELNPESLPKPRTPEILIKYYFYIIKCRHCYLYVLNQASRGDRGYFRHGITFDTIIILYLLKIFVQLLF